MDLNQQPWHVFFSLDLDFLDFSLLFLGFSPLQLMNFSSGYNKISYESWSKNIVISLHWSCRGIFFLDPFWSAEFADCSVLDANIDALSISCFIGSTLDAQAELT
jgi:hypothetical protein